MTDVSTTILQDDVISAAKDSLRKRVCKRIAKLNLRSTAKATVSAHDEIDSPDYYTCGGIETVDFVRAKLTTEEFNGHCRGSILYYISRAGKKEGLLKDLKKARWWLNKWISILEKNSG